MTQKEMASMGGKARAKKLSKQERHDIAMKAGMAHAKQCAFAGNSKDRRKQRRKLK